MTESEGGFKEFRLADLFEASNGDTDIQATHINGLGIPVVSSGTKNNGIIGMSDINAKVFEPNTITIDMFGNCYFQNESYKMVTHARVFSLSPLGFQLNEKRGLYFVAHFSFANKLFSYGNMASWQKIKEIKLLLPTLENGKIDWTYIESLVDDIINSRTEELNRFFDTNGFSTCFLTEEERQALSNLSNGTLQMKRMKTVDVFNVANTHNILKSDVVYGSGSVPYVTASESDNSVTSYISYNDELKELGNSIMIGGKTLVITYQPRDFFSNDSHNLTLTINDKRGRTENSQLFMVAALYKSLKPIYSWGNSISKAKIQKDYVDLPVTNDDSIDYTFMETYVNALKKQCIARLKVSDAYTDRSNKTMQTELTDEIEEDNIYVYDNSDIPTSDRFSRFLPLYPFRIACGALEDGDALPVDDIEGWIDVSDYGFKPNEQMFIVHAKGESMLPKIQPDDLCVFEIYGPMNAGSRNGRIVLARQSRRDNDYSCQYTIKEYHSVKDPETGWNSRIELRPLNSEYPVIELDPDDDNVVVVATLKCVL